MIERFGGSDGKRRLIEALRQQRLVGNSEQLASDLADVATLLEIAPDGPDSVFVHQGDDDNDIYMILLGTASIRVNGREIARREAGQAIGEMSAIDPTARRSASAVAIEMTVLARLSETDFRRIASEHPHLWQRLAIELGGRLRQGGLQTPARNETPRIFIGSSVEALKIAREIQAGLTHDPVLAQVWTDGLFRPGNTAVDDLLNTVSKADFAVLILTADDMVSSRSHERAAPRDNCVFELGLFMGALGRGRAFIVKPKNVDLKLPSDLLGLMSLEYSSADSFDLAARIAHICHEIRKEVAAKGAR